MARFKKGDKVWVKGKIKHIFPLNIKISTGYYEIDFNKENTTWLDKQDLRRRKGK